jgi:nascent polypeptide-associated complex subunit alpha
MMPGGRMNPRQLQLMMKRLGMTNEPVEGVEEVIIRLRDKEHHLLQPEVSIVTVQGVRTYQIVGEATVRPRSDSGAGAALPAAGASRHPAAPPPPAGPPEEDVKLVMEQSGAEREDAVQALEETNGAPAEAIMRLLSRRGGHG